MAKKKRRRNGNGFKLPIAVVAGFIPGVWRVTSKMGAGFNTMANEAGRVYLGYDSWTGQFNFGAMKFGTLPIILGIVLHKVASRLGVNRALASAGVPIIRI